MWKADRKQTSSPAPLRFRSRKPWLGVGWAGFVQLPFQIAAQGIKEGVVHVTQLNTLIFKSRGDAFSITSSS